jgi:hypothetical protein
MEDVHARFFENKADRVTGTTKFRLVLQPLMAIVLAIFPCLVLRGAVNRLTPRKCKGDAS